MWQEYIGKTILTRNLDDDESRFGPQGPRQFTIMEVKTVELNEIAHVMNASGDIYWTYPSQHVFVSVVVSSDERAEWYNHLGHALLISKNFGSEAGEILEVRIVKTVGHYALTKIKWSNDLNMGKALRWICTDDYTILHEILQE